MHAWQAAAAAEGAAAPLAYHVRWRGRRPEAQLSQELQQRELLQTPAVAVLGRGVLPANGGGHRQRHLIHYRRNWGKAIPAPDGGGTKPGTARTGWVALCCAGAVGLA